MRRPVLDAVLDQVIARMQSGETIAWRDLWMLTEDGSRSWAHGVLRKLHKAGKTHIAEWRQDTYGPATPAYRWGEGKDAKKPRKLSNAERCARWRESHPDAVSVARKRQLFLARKTPLVDPFVAAIFGKRAIPSSQENSTSHP